MHPCSRALVISVLAAATAAGGVASAGGVETLDACDVKVQKAPRDPLSYYCYYQAFRGGAPADETMRRLESLLNVDPDRHRARMTLGMIEKLLQNPRAESLLRDAMDAMEQAGDHYGVVYGGLDLSDLLVQQKRIEEAEPVLVRAARAAEATGDRALLASVRANHASHALENGDYGHALRLFRQAEAAIYPDGPAWLQRNVAGGLGSTYWYLGQFRRAIEAYERQADVSRRSGDLFSEAGARYGISTSAWELEARGRFEREACVALTRSALETAIRAQDRATEARSRIMLASALDAQPAIAELEKAEAIGGTGESWIARRLIAGEKAEMGSEHGAEALRLVDEVLAESRAAGDTFQTVRGIMMRAYITTLLRPRDQAIAAWRACLDAIEAIRGAQPEATTRARTLTPWSLAYYRFSGFLLDGLDYSPAPAEELDLAFRTMERFRARVMLDVLGAERSVASDAVAALERDHDGVATRIAQVQKRLMDPTLSDEERKEELGRLERLEYEEAGLRDRIAREERVSAVLETPPIPTLDEVRGHLREEEALLAFQVFEDQNAHWDAHESWLLVATRDGARVTRIPLLRTLEDQVSVFEGLIENRDGSERSAAADLYHALLGDVVAGIAPTVRHLTIIPDGPLHRLPFGALREERSAEPLGTRYEIAIAPSAAVWMQWRRSGPSEGPRAVLSLADPEINPGADEEAFRSSGPWVEGLRLGALPYARREARTLARAIGGGSRVLSGRDASEERLKSIALKSYGILHVAAHAVVDQRHPWRSAIFLATASPTEDGLLQPREIAGLRLEDKLVILAACHSVSGALVEGEGMMGLARAFLHARARAVIASLWPLEDEETAALMNELSRSLANGDSVASALATARRKRIEAGMPTAAWAGLIVIGDGAFTPIPGGVSASRWVPWSLGLALLLLLVALSFWRLAKARRCS